jgi:Mg-chelatase subunit ChlD
MDDLRKAASEFVDEAFSASGEKYRVGIISFDDKLRHTVALTDDKAYLEKIISYLRPGGGTSPVGLEEASKMLDKSPNDGRKKVVVLMTDGMFNEGGGSSGAESACNQMKKKQDVIIQTVFFQTRDNSSVPDVMKKCPSPDGSFSLVETKDELSSALKKALKKNDTPVEPVIAPEPEPIISEIRLTL